MSVAPDKATLIEKIMRLSPIISRSDLEKMPVDRLEDIHRGYPIRHFVDQIPWRPSELQRTWHMLTCPACSKRWSMDMYDNVVADAWCPYCGTALVLNDPNPDPDDRPRKGLKAS